MPPTYMQVSRPPSFIPSLPVSRHDDQDDDFNAVASLRTSNNARAALRAPNYRRLKCERSAGAGNAQRRPLPPAAGEDDGMRISVSQF